MRKMFVLVFSLVLGLSSGALATLIPIGTATYNSSDYKLIYDDDLGIVWLDYTNPPDTLYGQINWASSLTGVLTYNLNPGVTVSWTGNWRLPHADQSCDFGSTCTGSEMGHLYYTELENLAGGSLTNTRPFTTLQDNSYWSRTEEALTPIVW